MPASLKPPSKGELAGELAAARRAHIQAAGYLSLDELETHVDELLRLVRESAMKPANESRLAYQTALEHLALSLREHANLIRAQHPDRHSDPIILPDGVAVIVPLREGFEIFEP